MAFYNYDRTYADVARRYSSGNRVCIAVGGDSHGIRLWQAFLESDSRLVFPNLFIFPDDSFGVSGGLARTYRTHRGSVNMSGNLLQRFNIVVLMIGSNDPDCFQADGRTCWAITLDIAKIVQDLTHKGKIVYVVAMPTRFTFRRATESDYRSQNRSINKKLKRI